jgi:hypothetical protein
MNRIQEYVSDTEGARSLGWASIAIGLSELLATRSVERLMGLDDTRQRRGVLRTLGVRELLHGVSILTERRASPQMAKAVASRVAGDVLDNVLLGVAAKQTKKPVRFAAVAASVAVIGLLDFYYAVRMHKHQAADAED